jgi:lipid-A-disaccharide synthase
MSYVPVIPDELDTPVHGAVDLLIIAGEHSGDEHAAVLAKNLKRDRPELNIAAIGGQKLDEAGAQLLFDLTHLSVVGFVEVLKHYKYFKQLFGAVLDWIKKNKPRAVLFVDYPGFNLRLAKALHEAGVARKSGGSVQLLYYISPQVWAWKEKRKYEMAKLLDSLSVIFPFEVDCFADTDLETTFVGHPFLQSKQDCDLVYQPGGNLLLLAGSRVANVKLILPIFLKAYEIFLVKYEQRDATIVYPSDTILAEIRRAVSRFPDLKDRIRMVPNEGRIAASAVLTSSGTMSLRCGLAGIPGRVVHRVQFFTYLLGRYFLKVPYIGIANLLLEKPFYPEFIQNKAKPAVLAEELNDCLTSEDVIKITSEDSEKLKRLLTQEKEETPWSWLSNRLT